MVKYYHQDTNFTGKTGRMVTVGFYWPLQPALTSLPQWKPCVLKPSNHWTRLLEIMCHQKCLHQDIIKAGLARPPNACAVRKAGPTGKQSTFRASPPAVLEQRRRPGYNTIKRDTQKTCWQAYNKYLSGLIDSDPGSNKRLGALVKFICCDQTGVAPPPPPPPPSRKETFCTVTRSRRQTSLTSSSRQCLELMLFQRFLTWDPAHTQMWQTYM